MKQAVKEAVEKSKSPLAKSEETIRNLQNSVCNAREDREYSRRNYVQARVQVEELENALRNERLKFRDISDTVNDQNR